MPLQKMKNSTILYIEDDVITKKQMSQFLESQCKVLFTASNGQEGFELYKKLKPDLVITDIEMPKLNGLQLAEKIRKTCLSTQIIIITAYKKPEYLLEAVNLQLVQYLVKPISLEKINSVLKFAAQFLDVKKPELKKKINKEIYYDLYTKELVGKNKIIKLSKYERSLIELLITKYPESVSYETIDAHIYDYHSSKNAIKLLISALRNKTSKESVINVSGFGYKINLMGEE